MTDASPKNRAPPPVRLGRLRSPSDFRCAARRIGNATLRGDLEPKQANSGLYALQCAQKALELEQQQRALELEAERVRIEAARCNSNKPSTNSTPESVLEAWKRAPRPAPPVASLPAPQPVPAAILPAAVPAGATAIEAPAAPREAERAESRAPRPAHDEQVLDAQPGEDGSWSVQVCGKSHPQAAHVTCKLAAFHQNMHSDPGAGVLWS